MKKKTTTLIKFNAKYINFKFDIVSTNFFSRRIESVENVNLHVERFFVCYLRMNT